jgi:hypothetical protein
VYHASWHGQRATPIHNIPYATHPIGFGDTFLM